MCLGYYLTWHSELVSFLSLWPLLCLSCWVEKLAMTLRLVFLAGSSHSLYSIAVIFQSQWTRGTPLLMPLLWVTPLGDFEEWNIYMNAWRRRWRRREEENLFYIFFVFDFFLFCFFIFFSFLFSLFFSFSFMFASLSFLFLFFSFFSSSPLLK